MIKEHSYKSKLYGLKTLGFDFETLEDLNKLVKKYKPLKEVYYFKDGCLSPLRTLESIKKELNKRTLQNEDKTILKGNKLIDYYFNKGDIKKLSNPFNFTCEVLRGYDNTYKISWITLKKEWITAETKNKLWVDVLRPHEVNNNQYAEHTIKPVLLTPQTSESLTGELDFFTINWYGGNYTTLNLNEDKEFKKVFDYNLFKGKKTTII